MSADEMLRLGTYNALIVGKGIEGVYETEAMDFATSHKLFKGAMKTFNWEVLEVIGAPPKVSVKWRHWGKLISDSFCVGLLSGLDTDSYAVGTMSGNYRAKLNSGRSIIAKANGKVIEVFGVTVAEVDDQFRITFLETFWEPDQMFRQLISGGLQDVETGEFLKPGEKVEELAAVGGEAVCPVTKASGASPH